ncbi:MAG: DUF4403 family protein [Longimicrobiales bacterium]|nr:DUF4403 family protein [Longimicrobiales bacterium]
MSGGDRSGSRSWLAALLAAGAVGIVVLWAPWGPTTLRAPLPEVSDDPVEPLELGMSSMPVPVRIDLATLLAEVEEHVPRTWGDLSTPVRLAPEGRARTAIELARSPFAASVTGDSARLSAMVSYRVQGTYDLPLLPDVNFGCATGAEDPWPRLAVALISPIGLTGAWRLDADTEVLEIRPASDHQRDRCRVTVVDIDITGRVVDAARDFLRSHTGAIDSIVRNADVRSSFERWWAVLRDPIRLDDDVWLEIRPESISRGRIEGRGSVVEIMATLGARPRVVLGGRPSSSARPLPALGEGAGAGPLEVLIEGVGEYEEASRLLSQALAGLDLEIGGRRIEMRGVRLSGIGGGRVALEARIAGDLEGRLFLVGTPRYDPETGYAAVPDLAFSVSTNNVLVSGASWVLEGGLEALLRERARWPVQPAVEWAGQRLDEGLNRSLAGGVRLEGTVHDVRVVGLRATPRALIVGAAATADATLHVTSPR